MSVYYTVYVSISCSICQYIIQYMSVYYIVYVSIFYNTFIHICISIYNRFLSSKVIICNIVILYSDRTKFINDDWMVDKGYMETSVPEKDKW